MILLTKELTFVANFATTNSLKEVKSLAILGVIGSREINSIEFHIAALPPSIVPK